MALANDGEGSEGEGEREVEREGTEREVEREGAESESEDLLVETESDSDQSNQETVVGDSRTPAAGTNYAFLLFWPNFDSIFEMHHTSKHPNPDF